jgi:hypothetical protein
VLGIRVTQAVHQRYRVVGRPDVRAPQLLQEPGTSAFVKFALTQGLKNPRGQASVRRSEGLRGAALIAEQRVPTSVAGALRIA